MKISVVAGTPEARNTDALVYAAFSAATPGVAPPDGTPAGKVAAGKSRKKAGKQRAESTPARSDFGPPIQEVDQALGGVLLKTAAAEGFTGAAGQVISLHTHGKLPAERVFLLGCGEHDKLDLDGIRRFAGAAVRHAEKVKAKRLLLVLPDAGAVLETTRVQAAAEGALLASYRFDRYLTKDKPKQSLAEVELVPPAPGRFAAALERAQAIADGVCLARDLVNEPAGTLTPVEFARRAQEAGKKFGFKVSVLDERDMERERMGLMLAVAAASRPYTPPRVVRLEYRPSKKARGSKTKHIALVGKGLTFDTGGLDIKPADGMLGMKVDMSGAAAVLGAMAAIGRIKPDVAVTGYLGCVENGIGGNAYHPGDVLKSRKGLTVEINNTDAEGRLVLADCIDLCLTEQKPDMLVDLATLTGACVVALGPHTAGVFTDHDALAEDIRTIGKRNGEDFWRLPLNPALLDQLKSNIADMKNTGLRYGGAITAALFLKQFVDGRATWAHLDIAGPADSDRDTDYTTRGGAGFGVRTLVGLMDPQ